VRSRPFRDITKSLTGWHEKFVVVYQFQRSANKERSNIGIEQTNGETRSMTPFAAHPGRYLDNSSILHPLPCKVTFRCMARVRRGGYIFLTWVGDHTPRHVHVYRDGKLVVKWDLDNRMPMVGEANRRILGLIDELESEGLL
jgi:hypothetical protein